MDCGLLNGTLPSNARVLYTGGTTFNFVANYACDEGFRLIGNTSRICQADGTWSGTPPQCNGMLIAFITLLLQYVIHIYMYICSFFLYCCV